MSYSDEARGSGMGVSVGVGGAGGRGRKGLHTFELFPGSIGTRY